MPDIGDHLILCAAFISFNAGNFNLLSARMAPGQQRTAKEPRHAGMAPGARTLAVNTPLGVKSLFL